MGFMTENKINITQNKLLKISEMRPPFIIKRMTQKLLSMNIIMANHLQMRNLKI